MSNIFGNLGSSTIKPNPFASTTTTAPQQSSIFGQSSGTSNIFGGNPQPQTSTIFGTAQPQQQTGSVFGNLGSTQPQQTGSIFGTTSTQPQQTSIFGTAPKPAFTGFGFGGTQAQQQTTNTAPNPFGASSTASQPAPGLSLFGRPAGGISSFTEQQQQPQQSTINWGGNASTAQQSLQQQPQTIQPSRIWSEQDSTIRQRSVTDQIDLIYSKWNPDTVNSSFHTYLYNTYSTDTAAFFRPGPDDNEEKWEEALRNRPGPGAIPFKLKGFLQLGQRLITQEEHLRVLRGRLMEINNGLTDLLNKHDVSITTRTAECRRKHAALSQKCLTLATKTQVLRNRGYAMDTAEEELRQKLQALERKMMDPDLNGRAEEIWARMVSVRERVRQLQYEMERHGVSASVEGEQIIDEQILKRVRKILEDYSKQLVHLARELDQTGKDFAEWASSKPT